MSDLLTNSSREDRRKLKAAEFSSLTEFKREVLSCMYAMGIHSGYPVCCVEWWVSAHAQAIISNRLEELRQFLINRQGSTSQVPDLRYQPCDTCLADLRMGRKVPAVRHTCSREDPICQILNVQWASVKNHFSRARRALEEVSSWDIYKTEDNIVQNFVDDVMIKLVVPGVRTFHEDSLEKVERQGQ